MYRGISLPKQDSQPPLSFRSYGTYPKKKVRIPSSFRRYLVKIGWLGGLSCHFVFKISLFLILPVFVDGPSRESRKVVSEPTPPLAAGNTSEIKCKPP